MKSARLLLCVLALLPSACFTPRVDYDQASAILAAQIRLARFQALLNLYKALGGGFSTAGQL